MKISDIFSMMRVLNNELVLTPAAPDESLAITAIQMAQRQLDTVASTLPHIFQSVTQSAALPPDLVTVANVPTTFIPGYDTADPTPDLTRALRRVDQLWLLGDPYTVSYPDTNRQILSIGNIQEVGGQTPTLPWPLQMLASSATGAPRGYYTSGSYFHWLPVPDRIYHIRVYGLFAQQSATPTRDTVFLYPDAFSEAIAAFAVRRLKVGIDDDPEAITTLAQEVFGPVLKSYRKFDRSKPHSFQYTRSHVT